MHNVFWTCHLSVMKTFATSNGKLHEYQPKLIIFSLPKISVKVDVWSICENSWLFLHGCKMVATVPSVKSILQKGIRWESPPIEFWWTEFCDMATPITGNCLSSLVSQCKWAREKTGTNENDYYLILVCKATSLILS